MNKEIVYDISKSEALIMELLWNENKGTGFVEIMSYLNEVEGKEWKKQTINTFIKRLSEKGLIEAQQTGKNKMYYATITKPQYEKGHAKKFLKDFYNGSINTFLSALTGGQKIDKEFADELRELIDNDERVD